MSREQRRQQLAELVERLALGAILLKRPANFACGAFSEVRIRPRRKPRGL